MEYDKKAVGRRVQKKRKDKKLTQVKFDEILGKASPYIADIERGIAGMSVEVLFQICDILDTTPNYLLLGRDEEEKAAFKSQTQEIQQLLSSLSERQVNDVVDVIRSIVKML